MTNPQRVSRLQGLVPIILSVFGTAVTVGGLVLSIGAWQARMEADIEQIDTRLKTAEANQREYIPKFIRLESGVTYLVDRAKRAEDREMARTERGMEP